MPTEQTEVKRKPGRPKTKNWAAAPAQGKRTGVRTAHDDSIHDSRVADEREAQEIHERADEPWVNPVSLPHIPPRAGMVQRWIRVAFRTETDSVNAARKFREGWLPRQVSTVPKKIPVPRIEIGKYAGCIGVEGMVLCEMPKARNDARNKYFADKNNRQTEAIDAKLYEETGRGSSGFGPAKVERSTKVVREVPVAADE